MSDTEPEFPINLDPTNQENSDVDQLDISVPLSTLLQNINKQGVLETLVAHYAKDPESHGDIMSALTKIIVDHSPVGTLKRKRSASVNLSSKDSIDIEHTVSSFTETFYDDNDLSRLSLVSDVLLSTLHVYPYFIQYSTNEEVFQLIVVLPQLFIRYSPQPDSQSANPNDFVTFKSVVKCCTDIIECFIRNEISKANLIHFINLCLVAINSLVDNINRLAGSLSNFREKLLLYFREFIPLVSKAATCNIQDDDPGVASLFQQFWVMMCIIFNFDFSVSQSKSRISDIATIAKNVHPIIQPGRIGSYYCALDFVSEILQTTSFVSSSVFNVNAAAASFVKYHPTATMKMVLQMSVQEVLLLSASSMLEIIRAYNGILSPFFTQFDVETSANFATLFAIHTDQIYKTYTSGTRDRAYLADNASKTNQIYYTVFVKLRHSARESNNFCVIQIIRYKLHTIFQNVSRR